ncbi:unnamed protein product [Phytomonas sp. Hart1]|nr:unnamed protein product [Phytomonas sp. Hart1]|eukprot:CCW68708.1 unnamed protein product [Phytomonas sp. isolate Hart1]
MNTPRKGLTELLQSKFVHDRLVSRQDASRLAKLKVFLEKHQYASQWAVCCAALEDAVLHNVMPSDSMICDAIMRCGRRGKLQKAKELYDDFYRRIGRPRSLAAHTAFMGACAAAGDFVEANNRFNRLYERDRALFVKDPKHCPVVTDDLITEYLRAALAASPVTATVFSVETSPWKVAMEKFIEVRRDPHFRPYNELTPLLIESATQLAEVGGQWELCLRILKSAERDQMLVPAEAYDAAIRACFHHHRHIEVVNLMRVLVATRIAPDERSVRLAMVSAEEVASLERAADVPRPTSWALAVSLFEAMQLNGIPLYQQSYEAPLRSCAITGKWEKAFEILQTMRRDGRPISTELYRMAVASKIESSKRYDEVKHLLMTPGVADGAPSSVLYLAAMRCCMRLKDWKNFEKLNQEMKQRDMPESYDKIRLLIEGAYAQEKYHSVLVRFARLDNITTYELKRVKKDQFVRLYEDDFAVSDKILDMVVDSYDKIKGKTTDPMVELAYRRAIKRKQHSSVEQLGSSYTGYTKPPEWMFSQDTREQRSPSQFH